MPLTQVWSVRLPRPSKPSGCLRGRPQRGAASVGSGSKHACGAAATSSGGMLSAAAAQRTSPGTAPRRSPYAAGSGGAS